MTTDERRKLAELCGIEVNPTPDGTLYLIKKDEWQPYVAGVWTPDTNIEQAFMVEGSIPELSRAVYLNALEKIVNEGIVGGLYSNSLFSVVHANAEQRCNAALATIKEE